MEAEPQRGGGDSLHSLLPLAQVKALCVIRWEESHGVGRAIINPLAFIPARSTLSLSHSRSLSPSLSFSYLLPLSVHLCLILFPFSLPSQECKCKRVKDTKILLLVCSRYRSGSRSVSEPLCHHPTNAASATFSDN